MADDDTRPDDTRPDGTDQSATDQSATDPASAAASQPSGDLPTGDAPVAEAPQQQAPPAERPEASEPPAEELANMRPSASASVAAETAAAQDTSGPSTQVDAIPAAPAAPVYREGMFGVSGSGDTSGYGGLQRRVPVGAAATKPYGGYFDTVDIALAAAWPGFAGAVEKVVIHRGEMTMHVRREELLVMLRTLRDDPALRFELLSSVSGVHYPDDAARRPLHSVYHLTSMTYRRRIRLEVAVPDDDPHVPSAVGIYPTADWQERETWDLMGIVYDGHPGLTRIFMPDDWDGHPQRKDYPLGGIPVEYKGAEIPPPDERRSYA